MVEKANTKAESLEANGRPGPKCSNSFPEKASINLLSREQVNVRSLHNLEKYLSMHWASPGKRK